MTDEKDAGVAAPKLTKRRKEKQAVLLVHGMGEQTPMETLRGFVETMWVKDRGIVQVSNPKSADNEVWFKPDSRNDSAELWRITTRHCEPNGQRVDFYEFYWADVTASNTINHVKDLFAFMLLRRTRQVPWRVFPIWLLLWAITLAFIVLSGWRTLEAADVLECIPDWVAPALKIGGLIYAGIIGLVVLTFGDVARYCRAKPPNIAARREIRERGLQRLRAIAGSGDYDRIIVVGHSLGSIIAYDIIKLFWAEWAEANPVVKDSPLFDALAACAKAGDELGTAGAFSKFRGAQYAVFAAAGEDCRPDGYKRKSPYAPWLISDFVSVGAALSHAEFLLTRDHDRFEEGKTERRFPTIPPKKDGQYGYVYKAGAGLLRIDHAACFSAVRWTNVHDVSGNLYGDLVSGPVAPLFGPGAGDEHVEIRRKNGLFGLFRRFFTHNQYWYDTGETKGVKKGAAAPAKEEEHKPVSQLAAMRAALDLTRANSPIPDRATP